MSRKEYVLFNIISRIRTGLRRGITPSPVRARHAEYSMLYSEDDEGIARPSVRLLDLALAAITEARRMDLSDLCPRLGGRFPHPDEVVNLWPGEHYRLLAGLVQTMRPKLAVEIGTGEGLSALSMMKYMPSDGRLVTFDIVPWEDYPRTCLHAADLVGSRKLEQRVEDLAEPEIFDKNRQLLEQANLIFLDAAKDGVFEPRFLSLLESLSFAKGTILFMDDIRLWNMLAVWRSVRWPKLDLTSFGHWCGSGICELDGYR